MIIILIILLTSVNVEPKYEVFSPVTENTQQQLNCLRNKPNLNKLTNSNIQQIFFK